jgi:hypothetical protein
MGAVLTFDIISPGWIQSNEMGGVLFVGKKFVACCCCPFAPAASRSHLPLQNLSRSEIFVFHVYFPEWRERAMSTTDVHSVRRGGLVSSVHRWRFTVHHVAPPQP